MLLKDLQFGLKIMYIIYFNGMILIEVSAQEKRLVKYNEILMAPL